MLGDGGSHCLPWYFLLANLYSNGNNRIRSWSGSNESASQALGTGVVSRVGGCFLHVTYCEGHTSAVAHSGHQGQVAGVSSLLPGEPQGSNSVAWLVRLYQPSCLSGPRARLLLLGCCRYILSSFSFYFWGKNYDEKQLGGGEGHFISAYVI